jgi:hypothetical protein
MYRTKANIMKIIMHKELLLNTTIIITLMRNVDHIGKSGKFFLFYVIL